MIAITFALPQESQDLVAEMTHAGPTVASHLPIIVGNIGTREIAICHTGIGDRGVAEKLRQLVSLHHPAKLISAGFAGALDLRLEVADLIIATNFSDMALLPATRRICDDFERAYFGTLTTQPHVAETADSKLFLRENTRASAVDMETQLIASACRDCNLPMLAVRAISDLATNPLPIPFAIWFDASKQKPRPAALLRYLARNPGQIRRFIEFVKGIRRARRHLTDYLLRLIEVV